MTKNILKTFGLLLLLSCITPVYAERAGIVVYASGKVTAVTDDGNVRILERSMPFYSGESIITDNNGRTQLLFDDSSFVSLQPKTKFKVDKYIHNVAQNTGNNFLVSLAKGSMRMITGLIGKLEPRAVQINTKLVGLGIRGTGFTMRICGDDCYLNESDLAPNGVYSFVTDGQVIFTNKAGSLEASEGTGVYVRDAHTPPAFSFEYPLVLPRSNSGKGDGAGGAGYGGLSGGGSGGGLGGGTSDTDFSNIAQDINDVGVTNTTPPYQSGDQVTVNGTPASVPLGTIELDVVFQGN